MGLKYEKNMLEVEKVVRGVDGKNFSMCIYDCVYNLLLSILTGCG